VRAWMLGGMRVPLLLVVLLLASALAVPISMDDSRIGEPSQPSEWNIYTVVSDGHFGRSNALALDSLDLPHISYLHGTPGQVGLEYARWTGIDWSLENVDSHEYSSGGWNSIALDSSDHPHISYNGYIESSGRALRFAVWNGTGWILETVDIIGNHDARYTSIAIDSNGTPHISYWVFDRLKYANKTGGFWNNVTLDENGFGGIHSSLALDSNGYPHIGHYDRVEEDLKYTYWTGSDWTTEIVDSFGRVGEHVSLALDSNDNPHMSYTNDDNVSLRYARWNGSSWVIQAVDHVVSPVGYTSIALDSDEHPHISYLNHSNLKYARWTGSEWSFEVADSEHAVGLHTSLALDRNDKPHISYGDAMKSNLKYATKADIMSPLRSLTLDIDPDTLNLKSKGRWITAYLSAENASVHDMDVSTILLQDALAPERWDYQDDALMLKFDRQELIAILEVGESVEIKLTGKWEDGTAFEAYDSIRVIERGK